MAFKPSKYFSSFPDALALFLCPSRTHQHAPSAALQRCIDKREPEKCNWTQSARGVRACDLMQIVGVFRMTICRSSPRISIPTLAPACLYCTIVFTLTRRFGPATISQRTRADGAARNAPPRPLGSVQLSHAHSAVYSKTQCGPCVRASGELCRAAGDGWTSVRVTQALVVHPQSRYLSESMRSSRN